MEKLETIDFQHRGLITDSFKQLNLSVSDYTFANVYLFRKVGHYGFLTTDCGLFICGNNKQGQSYIMPLNDLRNCDLNIFRELLEDRDFFFPIPQEWLSFFPRDEFTATSYDSESDYIYLTENMASFKGKQYTRHRNHLNQFFSSYRPEAVSIGAHNLTDTLNILHRWQNDSRLEPDETDFEQCSEALHKFSELELWGTIYYIDKEPGGFIIGEPLNTDTFCLHFAKASTKYHGIYEFMFNDTAKKLQSQFKYLNLEEDMGNKDLRMTKSSYGPQMVLNKYCISLK